jgi:hypothetical protein
MGQGVPPGHVRLICSDPRYDRTVLLGAEAPKISGGVGGWETVARPRQVGMTIWQGTEPYQLELPVLFDGFATGRSREPAIRELLAAARGDDESEPSTWEIRGIPWLPADEWILNGAEPGDQVIRRNSDFSRIRQSYTLTFVEYVPPTYVQLRAKARQGAKAKTVMYRVRRGDTPASVARKRRCKWTDLRTLNQSVITRANQSLKDGSRIRVPVLKAAAKKTTKSTKTPQR